MFNSKATSTTVAVAITITIIAAPSSTNEQHPQDNALPSPINKQTNKQTKQTKQTSSDQRPPPHQGPSDGERARGPRSKQTETNETKKETNKTLQNKQNMPEAEDNRGERGGTKRTEGGIGQKRREDKEKHKTN